MLAKITKGQNFYKCLSYVLNKSGAEVLESNMVGQTASELAIEFQLSQQQHQRQASTRKTQKVVCHVSLSIEIGKNLNSETWDAISKDYLNAMEFDHSQYVLVRHTDTEHDHVHLVISRLRIDGTTVPDWLDYRRTETILRTLEEKYQLRSLQPSWETTTKPPTVAEIRQFRRTQQPSVRTILQVAIDDAAEGNPSFETFSDRLKNLGVSFRLYLTPDGVKGISYKFHSIAFPGYKLGKRYTWQGLQTHCGVQYESTNATASQETPTRIDPSTGARENDLTNPSTIPNEPTRTARTTGISNQSSTEQAQAPSSAGQSRRKANTRSTTSVTNRRVSGTIASSTGRSESRANKSEAAFRGGNNPDEQLLKNSRGHSNPNREADPGATEHQRQLATTHQPGECSDGTATTAVECDHENGQPTSPTCPDQTQSDADLRTAGNLQSLDRLHRDSDDSLWVGTGELGSDLTYSPVQSKESEVVAILEHENLWKFYSQNLQVKNPVEKDLVVAWKAFQDGCDRSKVTAILLSSPFVEWLQEVQGDSQSQSYIKLTLRAASSTKQPSRQKEKSQQLLRQQQKLQQNSLI